MVFGPIVSGRDNVRGQLRVHLNSCGIGDLKVEVYGLGFRVET